MPDDLNLNQPQPKSTDPGNLPVDSPVSPTPIPPAEIPGPPPPPEPPPVEPNLNPETPPPSGGSSPEPPLIITAPPSNKFPLKKILASITVFLLLVSIPAAVFLVQQRQGLPERAEEGAPAPQAGFAQDGFDQENWSFSGGGCFGGESPWAQIPPGWNAWNLQTYRCAQREGFIKQGTYSVKITNKHLMDQPRGVALGGIYKGGISVNPGASYILKGKSHRFYDESADFVGFQFCDATACQEIDWHPLYGQHRVEGGDPNAWYSFTETASAPQNAQNLNIFLAGGINQFIGETNPNDVYFDDVELVGVAAPSCRQIKAYDNNWNALSTAQLSQLRPGDKVRFAAQGQPTTEFTKARFRINQGTWQETTTKKPNTDEFYLEYAIPANITNFKIEAEVYHRDQGWK